MRSRISRGCVLQASLGLADHGVQAHPGTASAGAAIHHPRRRPNGAKRRPGDPESLAYAVTKARRSDHCGNAAPKPAHDELRGCYKDLAARIKAQNGAQS